MPAPFHPSSVSGDGPGLGRLKVVLEEWRKSLLDMGGRNRLLNFRHTRTATLEVVSPGIDPLLADLRQGWSFAPIAEDDGDLTDAGGSITLRKATDVVPSRQGAGLVTQKTNQAGLNSALYQLRSKSGQMFNDYGLWVLWLGIGMVNWCEEGAHESSAAPLVLVPVEIRREEGSKRYRLQLADNQERMHNPALAVKMEHLGVDWRPVGDIDVTDAPAVLSAARKVTAGLDGWSVDERVVLGLFASHRESMYQDLLQNEARILAHPLVRAVALGPDAGLPDDVIGFEPPELDRIDEIQLPETSPMVLDADASQRQCIAAVLDQRSFVMSGPPGTGKSQTITNMIAALMHAGRSVLFVSEKAAALDVVRNRLRSVGLGDFVLALHSGDTSKKAVATELARVLTTEARVTGAAQHELDQARQLRTDLSAHAAAMNGHREPLQRTLHQVLGRLIQLERAGVPQLPTSAQNDATVRTLSAGSLREAVDAAQAISRAWRPAAQGSAFVWRGLVGGSAHTVVSEASGALTALGAAIDRRPFATSQDEPRSVRELRHLVRTLSAQLPDAPQVPADGQLPEDTGVELRQLADLFGMPHVAAPEAAFALCELADLTSTEFRPPRGWFDPASLAQAHAAATELREAIAAESAARAAAEDLFGDQVLRAAELHDLADRFSAQHRGLLSRFSAQFKSDRAAATALTLEGTWDKSVGARLVHAVAWRDAHTEVARLADRHSTLLGPYAPRTEEAIGALDAALANADRIAVLTRDVDRADLATLQLAHGADQDRLAALLAGSIRRALGNWCAVAAQRADRWEAAAEALLALFEPARSAQLSPSLLGSLDQVQATVDALDGDPRGPEEWRTYRDGLAVLARHGADDLVTAAAEQGLDPQQLPEVVEQALLRAWADGVLASDARLRTTRGEDLDARVADFHEADRRLIAAAGRAVIEACNTRRPRRFGSGGGAVITREAEKKTRHLPVRELLGRTREVVQAIKPCFMMSPLTVSQMLPADFEFDVVIFDEASQVRPGDAINSIYRGRTLVVAGDEKQLPPTSFFDATVEDDSDEYAEDVPDSFESLLHACKAGAMQELPLRWHYRSRHENLITFSNREFYQNSMITFPGAQEEGNDVGVAFFQADGVYDRGGRRDNQAEAAFVAQRVLHHFDSRPGLTLGVVALSQAQASAIDLAVQQARLSRPDLEHCFTEDRLDGFFVKNLESVQGDERDVMIMSVGYGPDEHGKLGLNFGPINKSGGWRRLNVAVTRARYRMEVVASFRGGSLADSANESVRHLKRYLEYAEAGPSVLAQELLPSDAEADSPFEESVLDVLRGWGHKVQSQVGVAGYRIDIGLRHPTLPGAYALGIECDGAMYHSSKTARDRDRLREQVLTGLGWRLYRIWGTDWYRGRAAAELRLREAVEHAIAQGSLLGGASVPLPAQRGPVDDAPPVGRPEQERMAPVTAGGVSPAPTPVRPPAPPAQLDVEYERVPVDTQAERAWSAPYETRWISAGSSYELHTPEAKPALRKVLAAVIEVEGPVHEDLLVQRAREAWGLARAGGRARTAVVQVAQALVRSGTVTSEGSFFDVTHRTTLQARTPGAGEAARKVLHVAPAERRLALWELAAECPGMSAEELMKQACDFFGWRRLGPDIRTTLSADIKALHRSDRMTGGPDRITVVR
ncbi:DUF3320 domain-containing protein [Streptomyces sp. SKN60]|uniref:DUF3320 domain-containing protein n=1 Tax=Streptomyces sp. SKN60 TaxID=2855506 RepID=UPI002247BDDC|nr:DUF3320 domain-containing protein [Streptomyces sp. SKN60]MCX2185178.1 DUF3320 domain-containing protein [Streptomyces sp. SKN60]